MLIDLQAPDAPRLIDADICIVGGGAVGLSMAVRLARAGHDVVVLEGGGKSLESASQALHKGASTGRRFDNIDVGRYRVLGGSTTFWGGQVLPVGAQAMSERPWLEAPGWPIGPCDLEAYHAEAFELLGLGQAENDDAAIWRRLGVDPQLGDELDLLLTRWVPTRNLARHFGADIEGLANLRVIVHANATGLAMDADRRRIAGLTAKTLDGGAATVTARNFVLACGSIEIARLMLHPATDGGPLPWHANQWLGRGFADHLNGPVADVKVRDYQAFHGLFDSVFLSGCKYYPRLRLSPAVQAASNSLDISGEFLFDTAFSQHLDNIKMFIRSLRDGRRPDGLLHLPSHIASVAAIAGPLAWRYLSARRSYKPRDANVRLAVSCEQWPNPASAIGLSKQVDGLGMRRVEVDWRIDGREISTIALFARRVQDAFEKRGLADVLIEPAVEREDPAFLESLTDCVHQMSTARMGDNRNLGVVDANLRVYGTDNLYVAGQAVFPLAGFANPTFTAIALGLRLSDHLTRATGCETVRQSATTTTGTECGR
ncbi:MAG: GMC family oxidoreductase [Alphaproteobacteria bacterium]|nr:GMC family oxidoreductase [Alphaproteobacteria bacterium]